MTTSVELSPVPQKATRKFRSRTPKQDMAEKAKTKTLNLFPLKQLSHSTRQVRKYRSRTPKPDPNKLMAEKAKNYAWGQSFEPFPPQFMFSYSPELLCTMHNSLIQENVNPVDNIYGQLPSTLLLNRKFNLLHNRKGHLVHTKRDLNGRKASDYTKNSNFRAYWKPMGDSVKVCGKIGEEVGSQSKFRLDLSDGSEGDWVAEEFISVNCLERDTSIVFLKCTNDKLDRAESKLERTEYRLQELCQKKFAESEPSAIEELDKSIYDCQVALGKRITRVEVLRKQIKDNEDLKAGAVGSSVDTATVESSVGALNARDLLYGPTVPAPTFRDTAETSEDCDTCGDEGLENGSDVIRGDEELNEEGEREEEKRDVIRGDDLEPSLLSKGHDTKLSPSVADFIAQKENVTSSLFFFLLRTNNFGCSMVTRGSGEPNKVEMDRVNIGEEDIVVNVCSNGIVMSRDVIAASKSEKES
ncbi:hypothetical protein Tco_0920619 [Tanacetum coccineum]